MRVIASDQLRRRPLGQYRYARLRWRAFFAVVDLVGAWLLDAARAARRVFSRRRHVGETGVNPRTILVIQLDHLGDAVLSTGMLAVLRRRWPRVRLEVLVGSWNRSLFEAMPEVDRVHVSRVNRFSRAGRLGWMASVFWWGWRLRRERYDLGIDVRGEFPLALILWLAGVSRRLGWAAGGGGFLLTDSPDYAPRRPETESRRALLGELGMELGPADLWPRYRPSRAARQAVDDLLAYWGVRRPFLVLHISAGTPAKHWPTEHWRELLGRLVVGQGLEVVLVGAAGDRIIAQRILQGGPWPGVVDATGSLDVVELAALLERASVLVGGDSGPAHLAAAVGAPVVALFSGTNDPEQWRPVGRRVGVLWHDVPCRPCHREVCPVDGHPCMTGLTPERVARAVEVALGATGCLSASALHAPDEQPVAPEDLAVTGLPGRLSDSVRKESPR